MKYTAVSGDVGGTVTADGLSSIVAVLISGVQETTAQAFSGNVATLVFVDPAATITGRIVVWGR